MLSLNIVVVTRNDERRTYKDADAFNNDRGELIIERVKIVKGSEKDEHPTLQTICTLAVFPRGEWLYWERKEE